MVQFRTPQYIKRQTATGGFENYYKFTVDITREECITCTSEGELSEDTLIQCIHDNEDWWNNFLQTYLNVSSKHFAKSYTVDAIKKHIKHNIIDTTTNEVTPPMNITFLPKEIIIQQGFFIINWIYIIDPFIIDIPDLDQDEAKKPVPEESDITIKQLPEQMGDAINELNFDELPVNEGLTDDFKAQDISRYYEKQRVKEAKLRAKLAYYKAQRQLSQYYDKYGTDISDSDSDEDDSDED